METPLVFEKDFNRREQRQINIWKKIKSMLSTLHLTVDESMEYYGYPTVQTVIGFIPEKGEICSFDKNLHGVFRNTQGFVDRPSGRDYYGNTCEADFLYDTTMTDDQIVDYVVSTVKEIVAKKIDMDKDMVIRHIHVSYHGVATFGCTVTTSSITNNKK